MNIISALLGNDRAKIENLTKLIDLSLNENPLGIIPPFINTKIRFLSLRDTSLISAEFPSCYNGSSLQTVTLSDNEIRSIKENDFIVLRNLKLSRLNLDSASISIIDQNAFNPLTQLQSLSLQNNQLKSCEFLPNIPLLSSIKLDGNQFTSLPQQLSTPGKIKTYSFTQNSISTIDESSPLYKWLKMNYTNIKIYLANNSLNCCSSFWFIRLLKTSPQFVADASLLTCATPSKFTGKLLIKLNPDEMDCTNDDSNKSRLTAGEIIGIVIITVLIIGTTIAIIFFRCRRRPSRSGYRPIDGIDDHPYANIDESISGGPVFPILDEDDDRLSTLARAVSTRTIAESEAPTNTINPGTYAVDGSQAGDSEIQEAALIPDVVH
jgi:hypothetical protein